MDQATEHMATAIFDITYQCLVTFDKIVAQNDETTLTHSFDLGDTATPQSRKRSSCDFLGIRNSFLFWIDYTGALSLMNSSLDARLRGLADITSTVIELLEMVSRNLNRSEFTFIDHSKYTSRCRCMYTYTLPLDYTVTTLLTKEDVVFRRDIASFVRYKFPAARKGLSQQLGDSIAVRRRMLLQNKRHAKRLAIRRVPETLPSAQQHQNRHLEHNAGSNFQVTDRVAGHSSVLASDITKASRPDPHALTLRRLQLQKVPALTTVISTVSSTQDDSFEYPPVPSASEGQSRVQCPFCFMPLENRESEKKRTAHWERHVDEHLKPYACLFPDCAESLVFFARRHEWKTHMETVHSKEWLRKVHTIVWYCDIDHDSSEIFETELQWRKHMQDLKSHPRRALTTPTQAQFDAMSPRKQQIALRDRLVCPLCEQIPEEVRLLVENGNGEPADMYNRVVDHVAIHLKSLSLMALPSLENTTQKSPGASGDSVLLQDSFRRLMNENSVPQPPSGRENVEGISLPSEKWSLLDRDTIMSITASGTHSSWDNEYLDYTPPKDSPEPLDQEWIESWNLWKSENGSLSQYSLETDPILTHLIQMQLACSGKGVALEEIDIDLKNDAGRTRLSFAAETGDLEAAKILLNKGASIDMVDEDGQTPLLWAADNGHEALVQLLLDQDARIEAADQIYGRTPLSWAASKGHLGVVQLLLDHGAEADAADNSRRTPLSWAASRGHADTVLLLHQHGADIELSDPKYGRTPLSWAVVRGHVAVVKLLLDLGVKIDIVDREHGRTPLSWAAENGHAEIVRILIDQGANIEAVDRDTEQTPLSFAAENGHEEIVKILVKQGANREASDNQGCTALSWASRNGHDSVTQLLHAYNVTSSSIS
ncbi:hypothetical protein B0O99DRAFT_527429 [Bisporella sp. PMI_857]|nr:hypothetical protein B0O99DRAFT_527429 [Bisporella sp. PMI_857]